LNPYQKTPFFILLAGIAALTILSSAAGAASVAVNPQLSSVPVDYILVTTTNLAPVCQAPCECMAVGSAEKKWGSNGYVQCSETPCGRAPTTTAVIPYYCFQPVTTTTTPAPVACKAPCECMEQAAAVKNWGANGFSMCSERACEYSQAVTGALVTKYCFQPSAAPVVITTTAVPLHVITTNLSIVAPVTLHVVPVHINQSITLVDSDNDGVMDITDNCPSVANPDQKDSDAIKSSCKVLPVSMGGGVVCEITPTDNIGDACDTCPLVANADQTNSDGDGLGNACDNCPYSTNPGQADSDSNGVGDACQNPCTMNVNNVASFSWTTWRGMNWMTSVKDQAACGSCYAESPTGTLEAVYNIEQGSQKNLDTAEQVFVSPCFSPDPGSCLGGSRGEVLNIIKDHGVPDESVMPYQSQACAHNDGTGHLACNAGIGAHCSVPNSCNMGTLAPDHVWKVTSFGSSSGSVSTVKQQLLCKGPLSVCSSSWWHCVVLVGWDNNLNGGSWLIKNSWGTGWGTNGYGWIKFDGEDKSEIRNAAQYMSGVFQVGGA